MNHYLIIALAVTFFGLNHFFLTLGIFFRMAGKNSKSPYVAHSIEKFFQLISMICVAVFVPLLAFLTETVISTSNYILLVIIAQTVAFLFVGLLIIFRDFTVDWATYFIDISKGSRHFYLQAIPSLFSTLPLYFSKAVVCKESQFKFFMTGFFINFFLGTGFFFAFFLASLFPEYRLTLSQSAVMIHGIGIVFQSLYADPALARTIDSSQPKDFECSFVSYIAGRCAAFIMVALLFLVYYLSR